MSYWSQSQLSVDIDFFARVSACAAVQIPESGMAPPLPTGPTWTSLNIWTVAAAPGFADSYEYAVNTNVPNPGRDPAVITDGQILGAVQALVSPTPPVAPEEIIP